METIERNNFDNENHFYTWLATMTGARVEWLAGEFFPAWARLEREGSMEQESLLAEVRECWARECERA